MPEEVLTVSSKKTWTVVGGEASTDPSAGTVRSSVAWPQASPGRARATRHDEEGQAVGQRFKKPSEAHC